MSAPWSCIAGMPSETSAHEPRVGSKRLGWMSTITSPERSTGSRITFLPRGRTQTHQRPGGQREMTS